MYHSSSISWLFAIALSLSLHLLLLFPSGGSAPGSTSAVNGAVTITLSYEKDDSGYTRQEAGQNQSDPESPSTPSSSLSPPTESQQKTEPSPLPGRGVPPATGTGGAHDSEDLVDGSRQLVVPEGEASQATPIRTGKAPLPSEAVSPQQTDSADTNSDYLQQLLAHIERHRFYPWSLRRRGIVGKVSMELLIDRQGAIRDVMARGEPARLEQAALESIARARPLPPPPADFDIDRRLRFTIRYQIR